jgi:hypothetical protein
MIIFPSGCKTLALMLKELNGGEAEKFGGTKLRSRSPAAARTIAGDKRIITENIKKIVRNLFLITRRICIIILDPRYLNAH